MTNKYETMTLDDLEIERNRLEYEYLDAQDAREKWEQEFREARSECSDPRQYEYITERMCRAICEYWRLNLELEEADMVLRQKRNSEFFKALRKQDEVKDEDQSND